MNKLTIGRVYPCGGLIPLSTPNANGRVDLSKVTLGPAITDEQILEIAHRTATRYTHSLTPTLCGYTFSAAHMVDFARKILKGTEV